MGNKNARGNAAQARPSAAFFAEIAEKQKIASDAAKALAAKPFDMTTLPAHPSLKILGDKEIGIRIAKDTDMTTLLQVLPHYEAHVTKMAIEIHTPTPHFEAREKVVNRLEKMKTFYAIINKFRWTHLDVNMYLDTYNFPQMKLAAGLWGLSRKNWKLTYEVRGFEGDYVKVTDYSEFGRRLSGVYKTEFLEQPKLSQTQAK
ncbi:uncharacterized protein Bfra_008487 [Botrytis fragariae]|uniref:Uncharacterized protein n=1 Tax=Botrytis fragariae TaxID=1964551 RepID=A0A8H6ATB9_9HELO|nr:uncharacterized protein Bfra_008487 [Botrytis fragariae]KAF5873208.1 hypothetical protein Bfra_008487 [Botrytis fragariae]